MNAKGTIMLLEATVDIALPPIHSTYKKNENKLILTN